MRIKSEVVIDAFNRGGAVMQLLLHYSQALLTQMAQTAACYRHHTVDQQKRIALREMLKNFHDIHLINPLYIFV